MEPCCFLFRTRQADRLWIVQGGHHRGSSHTHILRHHRVHVGHVTVILHVVEYILVTLLLDCISLSTFGHITVRYAVF